MASLVTAMENPQLNENIRTCSLYKSEQFFGYGIAFHTEDIAISEPYHKLVYPLIEIESQSPADEAGMRNGQLVVAVNCEFVNRDLFDFGLTEAFDLDNESSFLLFFVVFDG